VDLAEQLVDVAPGAFADGQPAALVGERSDATPVGVAPEPLVLGAP
jgi:hypothetical protein